MLTGSFRSLFISAATQFSDPDQVFFNDHVAQHSEAAAAEHKTSLGDSWQDDISFASHPPCHRVLLLGPIRGELGGHVTSHPPITALSCQSWCCHQMTPDRKYNWLRQKKVVSASSSDRKHFYKILFGFVLKTLWILCRECRCVSVVLWLLHVTRRQTVSGIWTFLSQQWQLWSRHETDGLCGKTKGFYFRSRFPFRQIRRMSECLSACWAIQRDNCSQSPSCEHQGKRKTLFSCKNPTFWSFLMTQCVTHHSELLSEKQCQKLISLW